MKEMRFVCDGPPGPKAPGFVEVENERGESVSVGEWRERPDGLWELVVQVSTLVARRERRRCCGTTWQEGHRGTCKLGLMHGGTADDFWRDE